MITIRIKSAFQDSFNKDMYEIKYYDTIGQRHHGGTCNFIYL